MDSFCYACFVSKCHIVGNHMPWLICFFSVSCAALSSLANGNISLISDNITTWAIHTCNVGYTMKGFNRRMCQTDGSWDSTQPECREYEQIANLGSCMSAHVLLNLLNKLGKRDKLHCK